MAQPYGFQQTSGSGQATNSSATASIIAGQTGKTLRITRGVVSVSTAATGGSGVVRICDGSTTIMQWDANAVGSFYFNFGDVGFPLTSGNSFQLIVSGAGSNQATANCAVVALVC